MKKKIAVIGLKGLPAFGGAAAVGENIIEQLKDEFDFTIYSVSSHTDLKTGNYKNICYQKVFRSISLKKLNSLLYYIRSAIHALFSSYDIVHIHHRDAAFIMLFLKFKYPVLLTTHGVTGSAKKWKNYKWFLDIQLKYFVKYANIVSCVSKNEQRILKTKYNINATFIPNGIKINQNINYSKYLSNNNKNKYITFAAGRIIECKGLDILLNALKQMSEPPKLLIIGDLNHEPPYKSKIINMAHDLDVEFLGLIKDKKKLYTLISNSFLFVFPSRQEAMSIMLLEAASLNIPIIASDIIENKDVFDDNEILFFESNNPKSLQLQLESAFTDYSKLKSYSINAYNKLSNDYLWINIAQQYSKLYKQLFIG